MEFSCDPKVKHGFVTRSVPLEDMSEVVPMFCPPRFGDLVATEVVAVGKNEKIENRFGAHVPIFPGDRLVGIFGNRYATDQFEGYVPERVVDECDQLSVGGVFGEVASRHDSIGSPTRLRILGLVGDGHGRALNHSSYGLPPRVDGTRGSHAGAETIVVTGSSMDAGKTTTGGTICRSLNRSGFRVAAAKVTGTATGKDLRFFEGSGAEPVLDFSSAGYPSTYMLGMEELSCLYHALLSNLRAANPDYIVLEIADGIFQRETQMLLGSEEIRETIDHVIFAASDSLSAESGARFLREWDLPLRATAGIVTQSALATREAEETTGIPCLGIRQMMEDGLQDILQRVAREENSKVREPVLAGRPAG